MYVRTEQNMQFNLQLLPSTIQLKVWVLNMVESILILLICKDVLIIHIASISAIP